MPDNLGSSIFLPPEDTVRAWEARGTLQPTVSWREMRHEQHAVAFTVAKIAKLDLLRQIQTSLDDVVRNGGTLEQWQKGILPDLQKAGWWGTVTDKALTGTEETIIVNQRRLRTIYDTNVRMSLASGHWQRIQRQKDVFPYLRYMPSSSEHKRPLHMEWYGVLLPVDHPWWQTHFPPNGWFCKCHFQQVSERMMRKQGWTVTPDSEIPDGPATPFTWASGETHDVPAGIDPGFAYNPGTAHLQAVAAKAVASVRQALEAGMPEPARQTIDAVVADVAFDQFFALPKADFPVMIVPQPWQDAAGAQTALALLSLASRPLLAPAIYRQLPAMVETAEIVARDGTALLAFTRGTGSDWIFARLTSNGESLAVTHVEQITGASLTDILAGKEIILDRR